MSAIENKPGPVNQTVDKLRELAQAIETGAPVNLVVVTDQYWLLNQAGGSAVLIANCLDAMLTMREQARASVMQEKIKDAASRIQVAHQIPGSKLN